MKETKHKRQKALYKKTCKSQSKIANKKLGLDLYFSKNRIRNFQNRKKN